MSQLNLILILYILGSDWILDQSLVCMMFETSHVYIYEKKVFTLKEGAVKNDDINLRGMGLLSYPILSTLFI